MGKFQNRFRIPSTRADWHGYNGGVYFVTICTKNREHYLGEITHCRDGVHTVSTEPQMHLSPIGQYAYEQFINVKTHYPYAKIPLFVVMPDHIHAIVTIDGGNDTRRDGVHRCGDVARRCGDVARNVSTVVDTQMTNISPRKNSLAVVIRGIKSSITKFANENNIPFAWQTRFHDRIIRNQNEFDRISDYIEKNVVNWHNDLSS